MNKRLLLLRKACLAATLLIGLSQTTHAQVSLTENFDYLAGTDLTNNGWLITGNNTTPTVKVADAGLIYSGSVASNKGLAASLSPSGQDVNRSIGTTYNTGTVYTSFLVNISAAQTTGDYFFHLGPGTIGSSFFGRVFVKSAAGGVQFGLSKGSSPAAVYGPTNYALNITHLVVLKYTFNTSSSTDDIVELFINPVIGSSEPTEATITGAVGGTDATNIGSVALRQGSTTSAATLTLDGIQVGTTWASVTSASGNPDPTPVDNTPPALATLNPFTPADNATGVAQNTNLTVVFNEPVKAGTGNIVLNNLTNGTSQVLAVTNPSAVNFNGTAVTLSGATLNHGNTYAVQIPAGAITDVAGNAYVGFTDNTTWNFTVAPAPVSDKGTSLTALDVAYTQNFDGMGTVTGTTALPTNWLAVRAGGSGTLGQELSPTTNNGSGSSGAVYNVGSTGSTDRALGTLASGSTVPAFGAFFTNNTGKTITAVDINGFLEQWRSGSNETLNEVITFEYSLNATSLTTGTWTKLSSLDLNEILTSSTAAAAVIGNDNRAAITGTITNIGWRTGETLWIKWTDNDDTGSDGMYALDDFSLTPRAAIDLTAPVLAATNPLLPQTGELLADHEENLVITFSEIVELGTGQITVKNIADNTVQQISLSAVTLNSNRASIAANLLPGKSYEVTIAAGVFEDLAGNIFAGIPAGAWTFTTAVPNPYAQNFNRCEINLPGGWLQYSTSGDTEFWACTTFGRTGNAVQMNGFNAGNKQNEDWLISPAYDLSSGFTYPTLSFWSRTRFAGESLKLMISTDYSGSGNPANATWKEINGLFPNLNSDVWTLSENINLTKFKAPAVYIAFVYTSTTTSASRWTLDDVAITNAATEPVTPTFFVSSLDAISNFDFGYVTGQSPTAAKSFKFYALDLKSDLTVTAPAGFQISKDNQTFATALTYTPAQAFDYNTIYVRFINPTAAPAAYAGPIKFSSTDFNLQRGYLTATTLNKAATLDVVTWNIEWFGNTGLGPANEAQQLENAKKIILAQDAELYCVEEIANAAAFQELVKQLPGYRGFLSPYVSAPASDNSQRVGFIYKTSALDSITTRGLLQSPANPSNFWASGRLPYLFVADAMVAGVKKRIHFIAIHAKANENNSPADAQSAYDRRISDLKVLKDSLDLYYPEANIMMLGDFNDDVDFTVANVPTTASTYKIFVDDAANYRAVTKDLSDAGLRTYITFDNVIDHVIISDELFPDYVPNSAKVIIPFDLIPDYASTTSDHMPVSTRFVLTPNISFANTTGTVTENAGTYNLNLKLSSPSTTAQNITLALQPGTGLTPTDYTVSDYTVTVPAGATSATLPINILNDTQVELDETLTFTVTNVTGSLGYATNSTFTLTIQDDDQSVVSFSAPTVQLSESAGTYTVTLQLDQPTVSEQIITLQAQVGASLQYGATADYTTNPDLVNQHIAVTVPAGATTATFNIVIQDDKVVEPTEEANFLLSAVSSKLAIGSQNTFGVSVTDNDVSELNFTTQFASISENAGSYKVTLTLDQAPVVKQSVTISLTNSHGAVYGTTAGSYATQPAAVNGALTLDIPAGATTVSFVVVLNSSTKKEADKLINFALTATSSGLAIGTISGFSLTILDETNPEVKGIGSAAVQIAPNPSNGPVTLIFKDSAVYNASDLTLTLWNAQGQLVVAANGNVQTITAYLNQALAVASKGMYILKVAQGNTYYNTRLIRD